jgi:multiple sugar transport system ATP-binding protein
VFLFDEPLSNLDAKLRVQMRAEISKLQKRLKTTTVYVTHDQVEAMTMGDRIAILKDGDLQQVGTPLDVYENPSNMFVASFIGTPPMNLLPARITAGSAGIEGESFKLAVPEKWRSRLAGDEGREVVAGIRPEHLFASPDSVPGEKGSLEVQIEVVEPLGHENIVHGKVGEEFITATMDPQLSPGVGDQTTMTVELDGLHLFDAQTEASLAHELPQSAA